MKAGKLSQAALKRSVLKQLHTEGSDVILRSGVGVDAAAIHVADKEAVVLSVDPVTLSGRNVGGLGVCAALNDVAAQGATPVAVLCSVLLPTSATEDELRGIFRDMEHVCADYKLAIIGGHTEVTRAVKEPLITVTGVGKVQEDLLLDVKKLGPDMDLVLTKWIGLEGTAILAEERRADLQQRFSDPFIDNAEKFLNYMPVWPEAAVAVKSGACAMHDVSEGGIYGALWEMADGAGVGLEIDITKIAIRQETVEICEFFDLNPYKLLGGGSLLIATAYGDLMCKELEEAGIQAAVIGRTTAGNDRVLYRGEERRFLETTQTDELHKILM